MSPPIYTPDGSEVSEIVLPDGSTASEVIGPDGNVVFEAGPDIPDSVVDDFEDGDISEYTGNTGSFATTQSDVIEGNYALEITNANDFDTIVSESGLPAYPSKGDVISTVIQDNDNALPYLLFGYSGDSGYAVRFRSGPDEVELWRWDSGDDTELNSGTGTIDANEYYELEVQWHDGSGAEPDDTIVVTVYDIDPNSEPPFSRISEVLSFSTADDTYPNQTGVGWKVRRGDDGLTIADYLVIRQQVSDL